MVKKLISVDPKKAPWEQETPLHNRWHPDIPPVASVEEGEVFRVECVDWTGGQIKDNDSSDDVKNVDLSQVHYLSGPIAVPTAEPGDLLKVEFLNLGCLDGDEWVFTGTFAKENGGGFLTDHYPKATKAIWNLEGIYAQSRHIPGVKFAGLIHPGLIGTAPSAELLEMWNTREASLCAEEGTPAEKTLCGCLATRPLACLPEPKGAMLGKLGHFLTESGKNETWDKVASEAARTVPGRENGGNCDIKNLSRGCTVYFPVFVPGANLSMGDMHFSQGDGEVSFCGAIEMSGFLDLKVTVIKDGMKLLPAVGPSPLSTLSSRLDLSNLVIPNGLSLRVSVLMRTELSTILMPPLHTNVQFSTVSNILPSSDTRRNKFICSFLAVLVRDVSQVLWMYQMLLPHWQSHWPSLTKMSNHQKTCLNLNFLQREFTWSPKMFASQKRVEQYHMILA